MLPSMEGEFPSLPERDGTATDSADVGFGGSVNGLMLSEILGERKFLGTVGALEALVVGVGELVAGEGELGCEDLGTGRTLECRLDFHFESDSIYYKPRSDF